MTIRRSSLRRAGDLCEHAGDQCDDQPPVGADQRQRCHQGAARRFSLLRAMRSVRPTGRPRSASAGSAAGAGAVSRSARRSTAFPMAGPAMAAVPAPTAIIDLLDLKTVRVSQGTADIASRSNEALGGTLDYVTDDPAAERRYRFTAAGGDFSARKLYARVDTGDIAPSTRAFVSASTSRVRDWIGGAGETRRDHVEGKLKSTIAAVNLTAWLSYDDADEAEFGSVSPDSFAMRSEPRCLYRSLDRRPVHRPELPCRIAGLAAQPVRLSQERYHYRRGGAVADRYYHRLRGRGDSCRPIWSMSVQDGVGASESEYTGSQPTRIGGAPLGKIYFVTPTGVAATMNEGCAVLRSCRRAMQRLLSEWLTGGDVLSPYPLSRRTRRLHHRCRLDARVRRCENLLRAGFWFERDRANQIRDWHKVTNPLVGMAFDGTAYYEQYSTDYDVDEAMYYGEDTITIGRPERAVRRQAISSSINAAPNSSTTGPARRCARTRNR